MNAFAAAMRAIFADPNMAADARYIRARDGVVAEIRVIRAAPEVGISFAESRLASNGSVFEVRTADVEQPQQGDRIEIGSEAYQVQGQPERDRDGMIWTLDTRPAP